jgi:hypothetical protein
MAASSGSANASGNTSRDQTNRQRPAPSATICMAALSCSGHTVPPISEYDPTRCLVAGDQPLASDGARGERDHPCPAVDI